jgi:hypothetical protein
MTIHNSLDIDNIVQCISKYSYTGSAKRDGNYITKKPNVKTDYVKTDYVKTDYVKTDYVKTDYVKMDYAKTDYVKTDYVKTDQNPKHETPEFFSTSLSDSLFWCYFFMKSGEIEYEKLFNKSDLTAKNIKINLIEDVRKHKNTLKQYKLDTITNIDSNLANDTFLSRETFISLCIIHKLNVLMVFSNNTYFEWVDESDEPLENIYLVKETTDGYKKRYSVKNASVHELDTYKATHFKLDNLKKPILSVSSYKVYELVNICKMLNIQTSNIYKENGKYKSKSELYEIIRTAFK